MNVAVVGIGGTGSAALRFLAQAGHGATGFEQFTVGHTRGSSHGESRIIRYLYPDPLYTALIQDAYPLWHELELLSQEMLLVKTGGVFLDKAGSAEIQQTIASLDANALPYEVLLPADVKRRFPAIQLEDHETALFQKDSGFLRASACVQANVRIARTKGAVIHEETEVTAIEQIGKFVRIRTGNGVDQIFDRVIVTAGPWIGRLLKQVNLPLAVSRQYVAYLETPEGAEKKFAWGSFPIWIDTGSEELFYGFPNDTVLPGIKISTHKVGPDADERDLPPDAAPEEWLEAVRTYARRRFPKLSGRILTSIPCLYTNAPNEDFIVDKVNDSIWMVSGCSGHGFKFTVLLGKIAATLSTDGTYEHDISRFLLDRKSG
jgi:monomeric sarcosine oxidase